MSDAQKLLNEVAIAIEKSNDKHVTENHIAVTHNGFEYMLYKNSLSDLERMSVIEYKLRENKKNGEAVNVEMVEELVAIGNKTNWLYK